MSDGCLKTLGALEAALNPALKGTGPHGEEICRTAQRRIDFTLTMGATEDIPEVQVIQYLKNIAAKDKNGTAIALQPRRKPKTTDWQWVPGADGWVVDALSDNRCWPPYENEEGKRHGIKRNQQAGEITWFDEPGLFLKEIQTETKDGKIGASLFPISYSIDFKTDVLWSENTICGPEKDVTAERRGRWSNAVIASVEWNFSVTLEKLGLANGVTSCSPLWSAPPHITIQKKQIFKKCP